MFGTGERGRLCRRRLNLPGVETLTLDDYAGSEGLGRLDLIKLDVEGAEPGMTGGRHASRSALAAKTGALAFAGRA